MTKIVLTTAIVLGSAALAVAQNLGPGVPDVVMECFVGDQKGEACDFSCGSELAQAPGGKNIHWPNVSRVEFFHKNGVGRTDTRSWVFVAYKPGPSSSQPNVASLYIGPPVYCLGGTLIGGTGLKIDLRITKFSFN